MQRASLEPETKLLLTGRNVLLQPWGMLRQPKGEHRCVPPCLAARQGVGLPLHHHGLLHGANRLVYSCAG